MKNGKVIRSILVYILLGVTFFNVLSTIISQKEKYLSHDYWKGFADLKKMYLDSQYVNKHPKGWIPDETVNAYASGAYIQGVQPQLIDPAAPPLGRYLIGVFILLFGNPNIFILFCAILSLYAIFLLARQIYKNNILALVPVACITCEPIFKNQLIYTPLLDIIQLMFLVFSFYFFNKILKGEKIVRFSILTAITIGCFIATKFFITGVIIYAAFFLVLLLRRQTRKVCILAFVVPISVFILFASYATVLFHGYSLKSFIGIQKWVFLYHKSKLILPFSVWPLLLFNKWYVWFGTKPVISDPQWAITWPILMTITIITIILYVLKKVNHELAIEPLFAWVVIYILFFSFGQISSRYFVIYIPILYITAFYGCIQAVKLMKGKQKE